jgi:hypothetical protein
MNRRQFAALSVKRNILGAKAKTKDRNAVDETLGIELFFGWLGVFWMD